jgi:outer membrane lipoprotein SlyB
MRIRMKKAVVGIMQTVPQTEMLVDRLQILGFASDDISVLAPGDATAKDVAFENNTKAPEGAVTGVSLGGIAGGAIGLLAGLGGLAIPGIGPFLGAGPLMLALSGAAAGATMGGIAGALVGFGIPEYEAKIYEGKVRGGEVLVAVHVDSLKSRHEAEAVFKAAGAERISAVVESLSGERALGDQRK